MILLKYDLYNPSFWHKWQALNDSSKREVFSFGGSGSGKTVGFADSLLLLLLQGDDCLVTRKTASSIDTTVLNDFKSAMRKYGMEDLFKITAKPYKITCKANNKTITFLGISDAERIKGITQKRVYMNEISSNEYGEFHQMQKRLRGSAGRQLLADFNPIDEEHWLKNYFDSIPKRALPTFLNDNELMALDFNFDKKLMRERTMILEKWESLPMLIKMPNGKEIMGPSDIVCMRTSYLNNFWIVGAPEWDDKTRNLIANGNATAEDLGVVRGHIDMQTLLGFERDRELDYNFYRIYALGEWGKVGLGTEFYKHFDYKRHVKPNIKYSATKPLHITFDENVNPYLTMGIWQTGGDNIYKIDEIALRNPRNTLRILCDEFRMRYPIYRCNNGLFIYGDRTSNKEDVKLEKGENFYNLVFRYLNDYNPKLRLPSKNPSVSKRGKFINEVLFDGLHGQVSILYSPVCVETIKDLNYVKEAPDGTKLKEYSRDPDTKIKFEKYGHMSDADDYFICEYFKKYFSNYDKKNGKINRFVKKVGDIFY